MTRLQILAVQIQTDMKELGEDINQGATFNLREVKDSIEKLNEKIKLWVKEAGKIIDEAEMLDSFAEEDLRESATCLEEIEEGLEKI